ncbi:MAG: peptide chain release factor N(5)-glutamine methyltransferase [Paludibacteraceae bacterium]|nr:peptide chain release factor N(5)-glutamine methyltransferase [Paludibacteraceae bacterium]
MKEQLNYIISQLRGYFPEDELQELGYWIIEETTGVNRTEILTGCKVTENIPNIEIILEKLRAHVPVQYVFEHTEWMGLDLRVTPDTLIPRPETAELIEWILETTDRTKALRIADIGTGSGCIAIAIKKRCKVWDVSGMDISEGALKIAAENAQRNQVQINWQKVDILSENIDSYDIIVSNPPYICDKEKAEMDARVLNYEPHGALFVPDSDPLLFYRRIASLKVAKQLFFEINEAYGNEVCAMLKEMGYKNIILKHDMYGKPRMVFAAIDC